MDEKKEPIEQPQEEPVIEEKPHYVPRPRWQLVLAWILLMASVLLLLLLLSAVRRGKRKKQARLVAAQAIEEEKR